MSAQERRQAYIQAVVDTYGSYAFGFLHIGPPECAIAVVQSHVMPFYQDRGIKIDAIMMDNGREFCGTDAHPYETYLGTERH